MKIKQITIAAFSIACSLSIDAATISLTDADQLRDTNKDGSGNSLGNDGFLLTGFFSPADMHAGFSFQMIGPAMSFTDSDFSVSMTRSGAIDFGVDLHVTRIGGVNGDSVVSDYQDSEFLVMSNFIEAADPNGTYSLDAPSKSAFTTYLTNNWVEDEFIFLTLKSNPLNIPTGTDTSTRFLNFGGKTSSDATLTVVPEPSSTALLGLGGLALILRRRK